MKITAKISVLLTIITIIFMILSIQDNISKAQLFGQLTCAFAIITMFVAFSSWNTSDNHEKMNDLIEIVDDEQQDDTIAETINSETDEKEAEISLGDQTENEVNCGASYDEYESDIIDEDTSKEALSETEKTVSIESDFNNGPIIVDEEDDEL